MIISMHQLQFISRMAILNKKYHGIEQKSAVDFISIETAKKFQKCYIERKHYGIERRKNYLFYGYHRGSE